MTRCAGENAAPCIPGNRCLTHGLWDALGDQIAWFLESVTLEEVIGGIAPFKLNRRSVQMAKGSDPSPLTSVLDRDVLREGSDPVLAGER
jgi:hypothetical protein